MIKNNLQRVLVSIGLTLVLAVAVTACFKSRPYGAPVENTYRLPINAKFTSLDPHLTSDVYSSQAQQLTYENLYEFHFLKNGELIPALAESMPVVTNGGKTWTIKLKKGVRFQDDECFKESKGKGREVTAHDIVYVFERIADKKFGSPKYSGMDSLIKGIEDFRQGKAAVISGITAVDAYTVRIDLLKKSPRFIYTFTGTGMGIMAKECVAHYGDKVNTHAVGTGPYVIKSFTPLKVQAVRNPNFREEYYPKDGKPEDQSKGLLADAGKRLPFIDNVIIEAIEEDQPRWLRFMGGDFEQSGVPKDNLNAALPNGKPNAELQQKGVNHFSGPQADVVVDLFNLDDPVWGKKKELRLAYALARDLGELINMVYIGQAIVAHGLLSPYEWGYDPNYKSVLSTRDIERAKKLLADAGYPNGEGLPPIEYPTQVGATSRQISELKMRTVGVVGIKINPSPMSWPEFSSKLKDGKYTMISMGWAGDVPDAESSLPMFHSRAIPPHGQNYVRYRNKEYDRLVEEIEEMESTPARYAKIRRAAKYLEDDLVILPVAHRIGNQFYQPWVKNATHTDELQKVSSIKYRKLELETAGKK